jgi:hypothetical protein
VLRYGVMMFLLLEKHLKVKNRPKASNAVLRFGAMIDFF